MQFLWLPLSHVFGKILLALPLQMGFPTAIDGKIDKIVDKISPTTVMYLINAIYFKADWMTPFEKHETWEQDFQTPAGVVKVDFMHRTAPMQYFKGLEASGVALPYHNEQFAYFAILPDDNIDPRTWLNKQDPSALFQNIAAMMAQKTNTTVTTERQQQADNNLNQ